MNRQMNQSSFPSDSEPLSPKRRLRILEGAANIFIRDGYEGASMSQIAAEANVSKGTLYNYFESKEALFSAFVRQRCNKLLTALSDAPDGNSNLPESPRAYLLRIGRITLRTLISRDSLAVYRVVVMESSKFPKLATAFVDAGPKAMVGRMSEWLSKQIEAGNLRRRDPVFAAEQFFMLIQARLMLRARTEALFSPTEEEIDFVVVGAVDMLLATYECR